MCDFAAITVSAVGQLPLRANASAVADKASSHLLYKGPTLVGLTSFRIYDIFSILVNTVLDVTKNKHIGWTRTDLCYTISNIELSATWKTDIIIKIDIYFADDIHKI